MDAIKDSMKINDACRILFGPMFHFTDETLRYMQVSGVKSAYRELVKKCHPDRAMLTGRDEKELSGKFREANDAYNLLLGLLVKKSKHDGTSPVHKRQADFYYSGSMPARVLRFGEFLYYKKIISWNSLIKALAWQYRMRPKIGQICKGNNLLTDESITKVLKHAGSKEKFGETAVRIGFLDKLSLRRMLRIQTELDSPLGRYFVDNKILTAQKLHVLLNEHNMFNLNPNRC